MEQTLKSFKERQAETMNVLSELRAFLAQGKSFGIDIDPNVEAKLDSAIRSMEDDKLRVALIGGFSEGKTAIAAAWLERLDKSTMKISQEESSNAVTVYEAGSDCLLIDTPGLFGFKEQFDAQTNTLEKYKEITRKYVSEAHLVVYVMDPANPIKESHRDDLMWLFRSLNLLPRTVFVLSRFDAVADVEDGHEFAKLFTIKKDNVVGRLRDLIALTDAEAAELAVVAVAADPFEMGTEYWLTDLERFRALSRIGHLQQATSEKVTAAGGNAAIVDETRRSIVRDVLGKQLPVAIQNDDRIAQEVNRLEKMNNQLQNQLRSSGARINDVRIGLREFVTQFFSNLILQARGKSRETFADFFERNIGSDGVVLGANLQNAFDQQTRAAKLEISKLDISFDAEVNHFNASLRAYGKQGINYLAKSGMINNTTVLAARDGIVGAASMVGLDLSKMLKFKPWGAVNLASNLNGLLVGVGFVLEIYDSIKQEQLEQDFREMIKKMVANFEQQREELLNLINGATFEDQFFPELIDLRAKVAAVEQCVVASREQHERFQRWRKYGESIDADFRMV
jgi:GTP-binding protein EngB required for normal cell division